LKKSVLITGATGGLGVTLASDLLSKGYELYCVGRKKDVLDKLESIGCHTILCDFLDEDWCGKVLDFCPKTDILINNAGIFPILTLSESTEKDYKDCFDINVKAPFMLMKSYIPKMISSGYGRVVNILSSSAYGGSPDTGLYCSSKHALLGLTRSAFLEYRDTCVRVYSISPGSMKTDMGKTDTRQDFTTFIDTKEVSEFIVYTLGLNNNMIIDEVRLNRFTIR
tara:strand:- start:1888 stop:2559 length:672 start_codon:yes stop_codon:yes gene_type:complete